MVLQLTWVIAGHGQQIIVCVRRCTSSSRNACAHHAHNVRLDVKFKGLSTHQAHRIRVHNNSKYNAFTLSAQSVRVHIQRTKCDCTTCAQVLVHIKSKNMQLRVYMKCAKCTRSALSVCVYIKRTWCTCASSAQACASESITQGAYAHQV